MTVVKTIRELHTLNSRCSDLPAIILLPVGGLSKVPLCGERVPRDSSHSLQSHSSIQLTVQLVGMWLHTPRVLSGARDGKEHLTVASQCGTAGVAQHWSNHSNQEYFLIWTP